MMVANLYTTPLLDYVLRQGDNTLTACTVTAGVDYYFRAWVHCDGGTVRLTIGDTTQTYSSPANLIAKYTPKSSNPIVSMKVVSGDPEVKLSDFCVCENYARTIDVFQRYGIADRFNGDTMPLA